MGLVPDLAVKGKRLRDNRGIGNKDTRKLVLSVWLNPALFLLWLTDVLGGVVCRHQTGFEEGEDLKMIKAFVMTLGEFSRYVAYALNLFLLIGAILVGGYATTELATRLSARAFLDQRLTELSEEVREAAVSQIVVLQRSDVGSESIAQDLGENTQRESRLVELQQSLAALEFAGAQTHEKTVYSIQLKYEAIAQARQREIQAASLARRIDALVVQYDTAKIQNSDLQKILDAWGANPSANLGDTISIWDFGISDPRRILQQLIDSDAEWESTADALNQEIDAFLKVLGLSPNSEQTLAGETYNTLTLNLQTQAPFNSWDSALSRETGLKVRNMNPAAVLGALTSYESFVGRVVTLRPQMEEDVARLAAELSAKRGELSNLEGDGEGGEEVRPEWAEYIPWLFVLSSFPSDHLLALIVVCCGAIGSLYSGVREKAPAPFLRAPIGAVAGFICFLILKGGKFLFVVQTSGVVLPINPYAAAFAGIIAGLFTERAYLFLERVFDRMAKEFESGSRTDQQLNGEGQRSQLQPSPDHEQQGEGAELDQDNERDPQAEQQDGEVPGKVTSPKVVAGKSGE
ncbi:hypothetical protein [Pseudophaeobacter sp.]|uniref:hypothetical protein n=1 Tax=Pseudophaeobacter sp. TaxID=1971739 RepID=UPI00329A4378